MATKATVLATVEDLVGGFIYYDRKEDEELPRGAIEQMIAAGEVTVEEIVEHFRMHLVSGTKQVGST